MAKTEKINEKDFEKKIKELKIEMLKQPMKRGLIRKQIAKLLTENNQTKMEEKTK